MNRLPQILLWTVNVAFVSLYAFIAWHNRLAADDYYFLWSAQEYGPIGGMIYEYNTWASGWMAITLNQLVLSFYPAPGLLFGYHMLTLLAFVAAAWYLLRNVLTTFFRFQVKPLTLLPWAILFVATFFFATPGIDETWFWFCATVGYLWSLIAVVTALAALVQEKSSWLTWGLLGLAALYIGGSSLPLGLFCLFVATCGLGWLLWTKQSVGAASNPAVRNKLIVFLLLTAIAFVITYIGDGRAKRASTLPDVGLLEAVWINAKSLLIFAREHSWEVGLLWLTWPGSWIGFRKAVGLDVFRLAEWGTQNRQLGRVLMVIGCTAFVYHYPVAFVLGDVAPDRTMGPIFLVATGAFIWLILTAGLQNLKTIVQVIPLVVALGFTGVAWYEAASVEPAYAQSVDSRSNIVAARLTNGPYGDVEDLPALAPTSFLYSAELTPDTGDFRNQHYRKGLRLPFHVVVSSAVD